MSFVSIGIALGGSALGLYENNQVASRQDADNAAAIRQQGALQQQANQQTGQLIQKISQSNPAQAKQTLLDQFQTEIKNKMANATNPLNQVGAVSKAYTADANSAASGISNYGNTTAGLLSSIDAPGVQRQAEAADLSRYSTGIGSIKEQSAADQFLSQMKLQSEKANPWLMGLSQAAQSYGLASAGRGINGNGSSGTVNPDGTSLTYTAPAQGFGGLYDFGAPATNGFGSSVPSVLNMYGN